MPEQAGGPLPLVIWVHGGGWQNGSKDACPPLRRGYVARGYAVASINYRLSGHAVFPAQIEDCKAAVRWLRARAPEYGLDPDRFGVWGSSAGGHLAALLGTSGDVKEFERGAHLDQSSRVQAVCDEYGPTDFTVFVTTPGYEGHGRAESPESRLLGGAVRENAAKAARANPVTFSPAEPPFPSARYEDRSCDTSAGCSPRRAGTAGSCTSTPSGRGARHRLRRPEIDSRWGVLERHLKSRRRGRTETSRPGAPQPPLRGNHARRQKGRIATATFEMTASCSA